ncbi:MAG: alpha-amylase family protein [Rhodospirillales bacterium]|nr:alpha-amylase family protein [Acetobacter sp.]
MNDRWHQNAIIYCVEIDVFRDGNDDGIGDFIGLRKALAYLAGLGVNCLWLLPFYPSPRRDDGYDITDYLGVDPRFGDLGDFAQFMDEANARGIRVIIDLVVNHTSDEHPWFKAARREGPGSKYWDYYVWNEHPPADTHSEVVFPGKQDGVWKRDAVAGSSYFHRFYDFQPDLNMANPAVRAEVRKIMNFWLSLGVSGFRMDAVPFVIETGLGGDNDPGPKCERYEYLREFRDALSWKRGDAILLAEANVPPGEMLHYFGEDGDRLHLMLNFWVNPHLFLAFARGQAEPIRRSIEALPALPPGAAWAFFLRNHDELDLSKLSDKERAECMAAFAPDENMRLYNRGVRRRLAPMLENDPDRLLLAYSLLFSLPGSPVIWYGEELGMGDNLALEERNSVRTPMQWNGEPNADFSRASPDKFPRPLVPADGGPFDYHRVSVQAERRNPDSLLNRLERLIRTRKECPQIGAGHFRLVDTDQPEEVFAHACTDGDWSILMLHNLGSEARPDVQVQLWDDAYDCAIYLFEDRDIWNIKGRELRVDLAPYGYCWLRLRRR